MNLSKILIASLLITGGCAKAPEMKGPCSDLNNIGTWHESTANDTLTLSGSCTGTGSYCAESFTFSRPNGANQTTVRTLTTNNNAGCLTVGDHTCTVSGSGTTLTLNCGAGNVIYQKVN